MALAALAVLATGGAVHTGVLTMLPALTLAALMLTRPYLGERAIARLRGRRAAPAATRASSRACPRFRRDVARGGRLIATALAGRAPPAALAGAG